MTNNKRFKLSKNSWHYKYYRFLRNWFDEGPVEVIPFVTKHRLDYIPKSLCSYFWTTVIMTVTLPIVVVLLLAAAIVVIVTSPIWILPVWRLKRYNAAKRAYFNGEGPKPTRNYFGVKTDKPPKGDSLIVAWFKAYKQKHCPLVTLVD